MYYNIFVFKTIKNQVPVANFDAQSNKSDVVIPNIILKIKNRHQPKQCLGLVGTIQSY